MDAASVSLRPALISVGLELVAVAVLVGLGAVALWLVDDSCYNYRNAKTGDATPSTTILVLIRVLTQMLGGVLSVYACGVAVWIAPLLSECTAILLLQQRRRSRRGRPHRSSSDEDAASPPLSPPPLRPFSVHACRAAAVSTAALGLGLVGIGLLGGRRVFDDDTARLPRNDDDHDDTAAMMHTLCVVLGAGGLALWTLSSASLMASFWPSTTTTTLVGAAAHPATTTAQQYDNDDDMTSPLLLESPAANSNTATTTTTRSTRSSSYQPPPESSDGVSMSSPVDLALLDSDKNCENENFDDLEARSSGSSWTTALMDNRGRRLSHDDDDDNDDATEQPQPSRRGSSSTRRLLQLAAPQVLYLYAGCLVLLVRLPFSLAMPHFVSTTLAAVAAADFATARREIELLLLSGSMDAMLDFWAFFLFGYANQRIVRGLRVDLFRRLLGQEMAFFDAHSSGELASRLNSDCSEMAGDLTWFFRFSIESIVRIVGITSYMMWRSPILGSCALSIIPAVAVVNKFYGDWLRHNAVHVQDALAEANVVAQEALSNVRTVIAFVAESLEIARYESRIERQFQLNIKQLYMTAMYYMAVSTFLINTIVQGALLWLGTRLIEENNLSPAVLLAFMLYQSQLQNETLSLMNSYTSLIKSSGAGDKVFVLLDRIPPAPSTANALAEAAVVNHSTTEPQLDSTIESGDLERHTEPEFLDITESQYAISFENVSFAYPSRPENSVLTGLNLEIPRGQTVAVVGRSGCGKTTIVNLLQRFYDPISGRVLINGEDLRTLDIWKHRRRIGVVTQDPALFGGTLRENILYGSFARTGALLADQSGNPMVAASNVNLDNDRVVRAAQLAHADVFIRTFPDGYETSIGDRGVQLSGGQKQRIAIARAVVQPHSLLILDEATSSLDAESESAVQQALDQLLQLHGSMTTLVIAHRLRTVKNADKIVVLDSGGVVLEQGHHNELMQRKDSIYRTMVENAGDSGILPEL